MNNKGINIQDVFLNCARKERSQVTIYMTNGFQIKGQIRGFDNFCIIVEGDGKQYLLYKHAVSTVIPSNRIDILNDQEKEIR